MHKRIYLIAACCMLACVVWSQNVITITDADLQGESSYTWTKDNIYLLDGLVVLEEDGNLTIEAGTIIKGKTIPTNDTVASSLVIARGANIFAEGTDTEPIIFTAEADSIEAGIRNLTPTDRGLWGGLIVLGDAPITASEPEVVLAGLPDNFSSLFGGFSQNDNSGILSYVSIRHGGAALEQGVSANGLTLAGVGNETQIDHIDLFASAGDGLSVFGGAVNIKFLNIGFCSDDAASYNFGWTGRGQFWFALQGTELADNGGEFSGTELGVTPPLQFPILYNMTFVGSGVDATASNEHALFFRDGAKGIIANSVFTDFANFAVQVEDVPITTSFFDSRFHMETRQINLLNNVWFDFGNGDEINAGANGIFQATPGGEDLTAQFLIDHFNDEENANSFTDPQLISISRAANSGMLDPRPADDNGTAVFNNLRDYPNEDFFTEVSYKGAFGGELWVRGWTAFDYYGFLPLQRELVITDADLIDGGVYTWTSDFTYLLDGIVYLEENGQLNIEPGTVIKGLANPTSDSTSALVIARGAEIFANGTADAPIIFTTELDDTNDAMDLPVDTTGLWGGLIVLGNTSVTDVTNAAFLTDLSADDERAIFGGEENGTSSGQLRYVSIRHAGADLNTGIAANGLTLAGISNSTELEFVEVLASAGDGITFIGGDANLRYASVAFCAGDAYQANLGWNGFGQFWLDLQNNSAGTAALSSIGANPADNMPSTNPTIFNVTFIGGGTTTADETVALDFTAGARGSYQNSIFTDFAGYAIQVEDLMDGVDSRQYMEQGEFTIANNLWFGFGQGNELNVSDNGFIFTDSLAADSMAQFLIDHLAENGNAVVDPQLNVIDRMADGVFDPRPAFDGAAYTTTLSDYPATDFFTRVAFKGAFCSDGVWTTAWTALDEYGILDGDLPTVGQACDELPKDAIVIQDKDLVADSTYNFSSDTLYLLDGLVYLESGGTLNIEAGTVIRAKAQPTNNDNTSALIITNGASINAIGTEETPVLFTAEIDDPTDPADMVVDDRGLWGGVVLLGDATITGTSTTDTLTNLDVRGAYGGMDTLYDAGTLQYVSIRHAGAALGNGANSSGLTLAALGDSTLVEFVEVFAGLGNGIDLVGGEVGLKNISVAFCAEDAVNISAGYKGKGQYWFVLQDDDTAQNAITVLGASNNELMPTATPTLFNATLIGSGTSGSAANPFALQFDQAARGLIANSVFTDFTNYGITVEDLQGDTTDSRQYMEAGQLALPNNVWFGFGEGDELNAGENGFLFAPADAADPSAQFLIDHLAVNGNEIVAPNLASTSRSANGNLDPRPTTGDLFLNLAPNLPDPFFQRTLYKGAFCTQGVWIKGWTALDEYAVLNAAVESAPVACEIVSTEELVAEQNGYVLKQNAPNPAAGFTNIEVTLPEAATMSLVVFNMTGKQVATVLQNQRLQAGEHRFEVNTTDFENGAYVYVLYNSAVTLAKMMIVE